MQIPLVSIFLGIGHARALLVRSCIGDKNLAIVGIRLQQFLSGNFKDLVGSWAKDVLKERARERPKGGESSEKVL
jgi:hypothetical protein